MEDDPVRLGHHIGEHVQSAPVRHPDHDFTHTKRAAGFDKAFKRGDHRFAAIKPEPLGADIFATKEFLVLLALNHLGEDCALAFGAEPD